MRAQDIIYRQVGTVAVVGGQLVPIDIPRDLDYARLDIRLEGSIVVSNDFTGVKNLAPLQLLQNITFEANGTKTLCNASGVACYMKNAMANRGLPPALTAPLGTVATHAVGCNVFIDQSMVDGVNPKDSQLPSQNLSTLKLNVQIGNATDVYTVAADGAATFSGNLIVSAVCVKEYMGTSGAQKDLRYVPAMVQYFGQISRDIPAAQTDAQQILLTDIMHRQLILVTTVAGNTADTVLVRVRLERAGNTLFTLTAAEIRRLMVAEMGLAPITGLYVIDPCKAFGQFLAKITDGYDMRAGDGGVAEQLYLYFDVLAPGASQNIMICQNYFQTYERFIKV